MKTICRVASLLTLVVLIPGAALSAGAGGRPTQDDPFQKLKSYDFQDRSAVEAIQKLVQQSEGDKAKAAQIEARLIPVLEDPAASFAGKQEACHLLWVIGSARSVPALKKMLADEKLSDIARYALERNSDPSAGKALRTALMTATGKTKVGLINSLGERGEADSVASLRPLTTNSDPLVAEAAITALGKIGTDGALAGLSALPADRPLVGQAMLRCAERLAAAGNKAAAQHLYELLARPKRPNVVRAEALRGLVLVQSPRASELALDALTLTDPYLEQVAARIVGTLPDAGTTAKAITAWASLPIHTKIILLNALADRKEPAAAPLAAEAIKSINPALRMTGIQAIGRVSGGKAVPVLMDIVLHGEGSDKGTARESLANLPGADVEQGLLTLAKSGNAEARVALVGILADRPSPAAIALLLEEAQGTDTRLAVEAVRALGRVGGTKEHGALVTLLATTTSDETRDAAKDAVLSVGQRLGDRDQAAAPILLAYPGATAAGKAVLLPVLAEIGGDRALETLTLAVASTEPQVKQAAVNALADNWGDSRPLPTLLNVAKTDSEKVLRVQALRGYLRLISQDERMSGEEKVQKIADALAVAERPEEKKQALSVLRDCRVTPAVEQAAKLLDDPALFSEAADAVIYLAGPQKKGDRELAAVKGAATTAALDKVIKLTKDDAQREQAQKLKS